MLANRLAKLKPTDSEVSESESELLEQLDDLDDGFEYSVPCGSQPASSNLGTPLTNTRAPDLQSPETQLGLFLRLN